ncbi:lactosylceramide 4-alpha-galactosyltransferase [Ixodes scapularis]|nr:lactosylceramide 4-alpha-galactosyltransferase [Ixodes scapularis]
MLRTALVCCIYRCRLHYLALVVLCATIIAFVAVARLPESRPSPRFSKIVLYVHPQSHNVPVSGSVYQNGTVTGTLFAKALNGSSSSKLFLTTEPGRTLTRRQACVVQSAALHNPTFNVHLLLLSHPSQIPVPLDTREDSLFLKPLSRMRNVHIWNLQTTDLFLGSYLHSWLERGISGRPDHLMDAIKVLVLWNFGGTFLDLDFLVLRSFQHHLDNSVLEYGGGFLTTRFLSFEKGHPLLGVWLKDFNLNYSPDEVVDFGNVVLTRNVRNLCNVSSLDEVGKRRTCKVDVIPGKLFYPVHRREADDIFSNDIYSPDASQHLMSRTVNSYAICLWSDITSGIAYKRNYAPSYVAFERRQCPDIARLLPCDDTFCHP